MEYLKTGKYCVLTSWISTAFTGSLNIHGTHVNAYNSTNNNVVFFFALDLKILFYNNYQSSITMSWAREEKTFYVTTYLETKSFKPVQVKFCRNFNLNSFPQTRQIYRLIHTFQATGSVSNLKTKAENPMVGSWLQDVRTMWMWWELLSIEV